MPLNLKIVSDLHLEFFPDGGEAFIASLVTTGVDVLIMAGDICSASMLPGTLKGICARFGGAECVFVPGNHEFYHSSFDAVRATLEELSSVENLHVLDNRSVTLRGRRFVGTTLWFPNQPLNRMYEDDLSDFRVVRDFRNNVYIENTVSVYYLENKVQPGDVVVTHHLPCGGSVHPRHQNDSLNRFFLTELTELMEERRPALWAHGHTHLSCDHLVGDTRVVCNPQGYAGYQLNPDWDPGLLVSLPDGPGKE